MMGIFCIISMCTLVLMKDIIEFYIALFSCDVGAKSSFTCDDNPEGTTFTKG